MNIKQIIFSNYLLKLKIVDIQRKGSKELEV